MIRKILKMSNDVNDIFHNNDLKLDLSQINSWTKSLRLLYFKKIYFY